MPAKGDSRWGFLLENADVRRWNENLARGSQGTADNYLRILGRFSEAVGKTPSEYARLPGKQRDDLLSDHIGALLKKKRAGSYVTTIKKAVVSWLDWNSKKIGRRIKIPGANKRPTLRDAQIPSQDGLNRVLNVADSRARVAITHMAHAGLRPEVLGHYLGDKGLTLAAFPELRLKDGVAEFAKTPTLLEVPEELSKTGKAYFTFLGAEGCEFLAAYLLERHHEGETLTFKSPLITPRKVDKPFMRTGNIGDLLRKPMRLAGLKEPPYIWRSYFSSRCMLAESKGLLRDWRDFFMGHQGDIEHVYALHKKLPADTVEAMRRGYEAALPFLEAKPRRGAEDGTMRMMRVFLQAAGFKEDEIQAMDLETKSEEELVALFRDGPPQEAAKPAPDPNGPYARVTQPLKQRVLAMAELEAAILDGWSFRATLPDGRVVVEGPSMHI